MKNDTFGCLSLIQIASVGEGGGKPNEFTLEKGGLRETGRGMLEIVISTAGLQGSFGVR